MLDAFSLPCVLQKQSVSFAEKMGKALESPELRDVTVFLTEYQAAGDQRQGQWASVFSAVLTQRPDSLQAVILAGAAGILG